MYPKPNHWCKMKHYHTRPNNVIFRKPTPLPVTQGGTGNVYNSYGYAIIGNGYSAYLELTPSTLGNVMTSNGTTWTSAPPSGGVTTFTAGTTGFTPATATSGAITLAGTLATTNGGTGLTSFTTNGVPYATSTSALTTNSNLTFNGTVLTSGNFTPSSATVPTNGIYYPSTNTIGISSNSQPTAYIKSAQIGASSKYYNQLSLGATTDTDQLENLYVYTYTSAVNQCSTSTAQGNIYTYNGIPFSLAQAVYSQSAYPDLTYCVVGISSYAQSGYYIPTQFPTGAFQTFPAICYYGKTDSSASNQGGTCYYGVADSFYNNGTAYYARTRSQAPTSGSSYCYRSDIGSHIFSGEMTGFHSRIISGLGSSGTYYGTIGWHHVDETPTNAWAYVAAKFDKGGVSVGSITLTASTTTYNTTSDPRLKNITGLIQADEAKLFVMALQPKKGTWKKTVQFFKVL